MNVFDCYQNRLNNSQHDWTRLEKTGQGGKTTQHFTLDICPMHVRCRCPVVLPGLKGEKAMDGLLNRRWGTQGYSHLKPCSYVMSNRCILLCLKCKTVSLFHHLIAFLCHSYLILIYHGESCLWWKWLMNWRSIISTYFHPYYVDVWVNIDAVCFFLLRFPVVKTFCLAEKMTHASSIQYPIRTFEG